MEVGNADERPVEEDKLTSEWRTLWELDGQSWAGQGAEADRKGTGWLRRLGPKRWRRKLAESGVFPCWYIFGRREKSAESDF